MQLSSEPMNKSIEKQLSEMMIGVISELNSPLEIKTVLTDLLTESERLSIVKRLGIALYLDKGRSYEDIKKNIKVSSATIASVAENIGNPGWQEMIRRIKADQWAESITNKLSKSIRDIFGGVK